MVKFNETEEPATPNKGDKRKSSTFNSKDEHKRTKKGNRLENGQNSSPSKLQQDTVINGIQVLNDNVEVDTMTSKSTHVNEEKVKCKSKKSDVASTEDAMDKDSKSTPVNEEKVKCKSKKSIVASTEDAVDKDSKSTPVNEEKVKCKSKKSNVISTEDAVDKDRTVKTKENLNINEEKERTLYVHNLPPTLKEEHLKKFFGKYGKIDSLNLITRQPNHRCYITFKEAADMNRALEVTGLLYQGYYIITSKHFDNPDFACFDKKTAFISRLPEGCGINKLFQTFESCGNITNISISGTVKKIAFITFESADSVEMAQEIKQIGNKLISVYEYRLPNGNKSIAVKTRPGFNRHRNDTLMKTLNNKRSFNQPRKSFGKHPRVKSGFIRKRFN